MRLEHFGACVPSGHRPPTDKIATIFIASVPLPASGKPKKTMILPNGSHPGHAHSTSVRSMESARAIIRPRPSSWSPLSFTPIVTSGAASAKRSISARVSCGVPPIAASNCTMSPPGGRSGRWMIFTLHPSPIRIRATLRAYSSPGGSLSGKIQTSRPASGVQSLSSDDDEPCAEVTAARPSSAARSAQASPSKTTIGSSGGISSRRYSGSGFGASPIAHAPFSSRCTGRNSLSPFGRSKRATRITSPG